MTSSSINTQLTEPNWRFCTAPMMEWSDRHCRYLWRLLSKNARLYTEMVTTPALIFGDRERFLKYNIAEQPVALQLGGSDIKQLIECAKIGEQAGYNEINLNCGCPSDRVQENKIGACLMAEPQLVADCLSNMQNAVKIPVTVKHRTGIDDLDSEEYLHEFVTTVASAGINVFIVHARKAWLKGLSPKENREIPPLDYERVFRLKSKFSNLTIVSNGGIDTIQQCHEQLKHLDGVMMGRAAYHNPFVLSDVDTQLFNTSQQAQASLTRQDVLNAYIEYCWAEYNQGTRLHYMSRHVLGLFHGQPGGRLFRRYISDHACLKGATPEVLTKAFEAMQVHSDSPE